MNREPKICRMCGKEFIPAHRNALYCSDDCRYNAVKKCYIRKCVYCKVCGAELPKGTRNYCTDCLLKYYHETHSRGAYNSLVRRGLGDLLMMEHLASKNYKK